MIEQEHKEALEVIEASENSINIVYERPDFTRRVFANFIDILILVLAFISSFIFVGMIVKSTPPYKNADATVTEVRRDSKLFLYSPARKTWENISTWYDNDGTTSYGFRVTNCSLAITNFQYYIAMETNEADKLLFFKTMSGDYDFVEGKGIDDIQSEQFKYIYAKYNEVRLDPELVFKPSDTSNPAYGKPLFVTNSTGEVIRNPEVYTDTAGDGVAKYYYNHFYSDYTLIDCGGYLVKYVPRYQKAMKAMSSSLFYVQFPSTIILSVFLTYLLPPLLWRRNHFTVGKFSMQIGIVDSRCLSPTFGRYFSRWCIFLFSEIILSFFTFGLPFLISFSMMAFSKNRQGFPDYMLGLNEVDVRRQKIYYTKYEVAVEHAKNHKQAISFEMERREHL